MMRAPALFVGLAASLLVSAEQACCAGLPIDLEVAVVQAAPLGAMQEWGRLLSELGLSGVRLRGAHGGDKPAVTPVGSGGSQRFRVLAVLNHRDQLVLPGAAFGQGEVAKLRQYFEGLPLATAEKGVDRGIFGLTRPQFEQLYADLSAEVTESTKGAPPQPMLDALSRGLSVPVSVDTVAHAALGRAKPLSVELKGMTLGTSAALALRTAGIALLPEQPPGKPFVVRVVLIEPNQMYWPVGWKPEKTPRQLSPPMYRFTTIEITGHKLPQALAALAPHLGLPLIYDEHVMAREQIDITKVEVKFPNRRTYIRRAVDNVLSQARLSGEVRVDEAGRPFYWVTRFGPLSPKALGTDPATRPIAAASGDQPAAP
jgi:hypothetical protein